MPPLAVSEAVYGEPTTPVGRALLVIVKPGLIVIVSPVVDAVWCVGLVESVAVMVTATGPPVAVVGVPLITPVPVLIDRPAGRPVAEYVYGAVPPLAVSDAVYVFPITPFGSGLLVIDSPEP